MSQEATIYLNTPLRDTGDEPALPINSYRIRGKITKKEDHGLEIDVKALGTEKKWFKSKLAVKAILIPWHKVDFIDLG